MTDALEDYAAQMNAEAGGWNHAMGLHFVRATKDEVVATFTVGAIHRQPYGVVHGGVHCGVIEAACSTGAAISAMANGRTVVGLENATSFLRAVREGTLTVTARPLAHGRRSEVWEAKVVDATGRAVAAGRVRAMCLEPGAALAGEPAGVKT